MNIVPSDKAISKALSDTSIYVARIYCVLIKRDHGWYLKSNEFNISVESEIHARNMLKDAGYLMDVYATEKLSDDEFIAWFDYPCTEQCREYLLTPYSNGQCGHMEITICE